MDQILRTNSPAGVFPNCCWPSAGLWRLRSSRFDCVETKWVAGVIEQDLNVLCVQFAVACEPVCEATLAVSSARVIAERKGLSAVLVNSYYHLIR